MCLFYLEYLCLCLLYIVCNRKCKFGARCSDCAEIVEQEHYNLSRIVLKLSNVNPETSVIKASETLIVFVRALCDTSTCSRLEMALAY